MFRRLVLLTLAAAVLAGCATATRLDAAGDVHALLVAIRDDDRAAFNARVDRKALKRSVEARLVAEARKATDDPALMALGALAAPAIADMADKALVQPSTFRSVAYYYGYRPDQPLPGRVAIAGALRYLDNGRVCVTRKKDGPCLLTFTLIDGVWKLSGFEGDVSDLKLGR
jgi:hypothetical protein